MLKIYLASAFANQAPGAAARGPGPVALLSATDAGLRLEMTGFPLGAMRPAAILLCGFVPIGRQASTLRACCLTSFMPSNGCHPFGMCCVHEKWRFAHWRTATGMSPHRALMTP